MKRSWSRLLVPVVLVTVGLAAASPASAGIYSRSYHTFDRFDTTGSSANVVEPFHAGADTGHAVYPTAVFDGMRTDGAAPYGRIAQPGVNAWETWTLPVGETYADVVVHVQLCRYTAEQWRGGHALSVYAVWTADQANAAGTGVVGGRVDLASDDDRWTPLDGGRTCRAFSLAPSPQGSPTLLVGVYRAPAPTPPPGYPQSPPSAPVWVEVTGIEAAATDPSPPAVWVYQREGVHVHSLQTTLECAASDGDESGVGVVLRRVVDQLAGGAPLSGWLPVPCRGAGDVDTLDLATLAPGRTDGVFEVQYQAIDAAGNRSPIEARTIDLELPPVAQTPTIGGSLQVGSTLSGAAGAWAGRQPVGYAYQWVRCNAAAGNCSPISGANGTTYRLLSADLGAEIRLDVSATNTFGSTTASSELTQPVPLAATSPTGAGVTVPATAAVPAGATLVRWHSCHADGSACHSIAGATSLVYTPTLGDYGQLLYVSYTLAGDDEQTAPSLVGAGAAAWLGDASIHSTLSAQSHFATIGRTRRIVISGRLRSTDHLAGVGGETIRIVLRSRFGSASTQAVTNANGSWSVAYPMGMSVQPQVSFAGSAAARPVAPRVKRYVVYRPGLRLRLRGVGATIRGGAAGYRRVLATITFYGHPVAGQRIEVLTPGLRREDRSAKRPTIGVARRAFPASTAIAMPLGSPNPAAQLRRWRVWLPEGFYPAALRYFAFYDGRGSRGIPYGPALSRFVSIANG